MPLNPLLEWAPKASTYSETNGQLNAWNSAIAVQGSILRVQGNYYKYITDLTLWTGKDSMNKYWASWAGCLLRWLFFSVKWNSHSNLEQNSLMRKRKYSEARKSYCCKLFTIYYVGIESYWIWKQWLMSLWMKKLEGYYSLYCEWQFETDRTNAYIVSVIKRKRLIWGRSKWSIKCLNWAR